VCASALRLQSLVGTVALTADAVAAEVARLRKDHFSSSAADLPTRLPVVLIVGPALVHLPLESLPALRSGGGAEGGGGQVLTRMSSWTFMAAALEAHAAAAAAAPVPPQLAGPTDEQGYYVLNPQQNLPRAEQLLPLLEERGWAGSKGAPRVDEWKDALRRPSYFVYVGHNGGEEFVTPRTIRASPTGVSAVALQMGCCSALQRVAKGGARALYEPEGLSLAYQIARCPAMIGCLWTVSDDVDRWTARMLTEVHEQRQRNATATAAIAASQTATAAAAPARGRKTKAAAAAATTPAAAAPTPATPPSVSLQQLALASLPACNKPFLTGAAIVCYGLPVGV
jgi:separase